MAILNSNEFSIKPNISGGPLQKLPYDFSRLWRRSSLFFKRAVKVTNRNSNVPVILDGIFNIYDQEKVADAPGDLIGLPCPNFCEDDDGKKKGLVINSASFTFWNVNQGRPATQESYSLELIVPDDDFSQNFTPSEVNQIQNQIAGVTLSLFKLKIIDQRPGSYTIGKEFDAIIALDKDGRIMDSETNGVLHKVAINDTVR